MQSRRIDRQCHFENRRSGLSKHQVIAVTARTLDDLALESRVRAVFSDQAGCGGSGSALLEGAQRFIQRHRPIIAGEFNSVFIKNFGHTFLDAVAILRPWSYRIFAFLKATHLVEISEPEAGRGDVVLVPSEKVGWLSERVTVECATE